MENQIHDTTILKLSAANSFVEISVDSVAIGKIKMAFRKVDNSKEKGAKIVEKIDFYLDPFEALFLSEEILNGSIARAIKASIEKNPEFPPPVYELLRGTSGKEEIISRVLFIQKSKSANMPYLLKVIQGPGKESETKAIVPLYNYNKAPQTVMVPVESKDFKIMAFALKEIATIFLHNEIKTKINNHLNYKTNKK